MVADCGNQPGNKVRRQARARGIVEPPGGLIIPTGIANPVLIALGVAVLMTILATRRRFGRYVFAIVQNGSPVPYWTARVAQDRFVTVLARS